MCLKQRKTKENKGESPSQTPTSIDLHRCAVRNASGAGAPPTILKKQKKEQVEKRQEHASRPPGGILSTAASSSASHAIYVSILAAYADPSSVPSANVLPTPDNSRKRTKHFSYLGSANNLRTFPGFLPSHASILAATSLGLRQLRSM
jgi:hypothetical protein